MRKKYLSALLFGALLFASAGTFTSCKDYDDDINNLTERVDQLAKDLEDLKTKVEVLGGVESIEFKDGQLIVHTTKGDVSANMPECTGIQEVKLEGNTLYVDGKAAGTVELNEDGTAPVIEVGEDGKLYVNGKVMDIAVGDKVTVVDNGETVTLTVVGQPSVELAKAGSAILSFIEIEESTSDFVGIESFSRSIKWGKAAVATPDWKGSKGAVTLNQLLIGQISTATVQVTPAAYDLAAHELTLVDARGNKAPVKITPVKNNVLKSRSAFESGSWNLSIVIDETAVNAGNIASVFDYDPETTTGDAMAYTLCVDGVPYTTYSFAVKPADAASTNVAALTNVSALSFVDGEGRVKEVGQNKTGKLPVNATTPLFIKNDNVYDYYYTFEDTNKSLAEQYGITVSEDGKAIYVPAGAEGVKITVTAHVMTINGRVSDNSQNKVKLTIAGSEVAAETLATTEHLIIPGEATKAIRVNFGDGEDNVFAKFSAAAREAVRNNKASIKIKEEATQLGFLISSDAKTHEFAYSTVWTLHKKNGSTWSSATDDILDLSYMEMKVANNISTDAIPGDYKLTFVAVTNGDAGDPTDNEILKVNVPVKIAVPAFEDIFKKDANWNEAGDTYSARIIIPNGTGYATLRYIDAFAKNKYTNNGVNVSSIGIVFNAVEENSQGNSWPIVGGTEFVTNGVQAVTVGINKDVTLYKTVVYNKEGNALKVDKLEDMCAYYNVFDGVTSVSGGSYDAFRKAFTVVSKPFTTQIVTALDDVKVAYYIDGVEQSNVTLTDNNAILGGIATDPTKKETFNGLFFELVDDFFGVRMGQFAGTSASGATPDKLYIFDLYDNIQTPNESLTGNKVQVTFKDANASGLSWSDTAGNTDNYGLKFTSPKDASVLNIMFKDATGIEYQRSIKVQKAK